MNFCPRFKSVLGSPIASYLSILKLTFFILLFLQILFFFWSLHFHFLCFYDVTNWEMSPRSRHWEFLCRTAVPQDITKIVNFFWQSWSFQYSLLNKKVWKFINRVILHMHFSRAMVKRSKLQLYWTNIFLVQLWKAASDHLFNISAIKKIGRWKI